MSQQEIGNEIVLVMLETQQKEAFRESQPPGLTPSAKAGLLTVMEKIPVIRYNPIELD